MSLVFSAFVPHSPVLLPTLGQEHLDKAQQTINGFKYLEQELYATKPDTILIVSAHGEKMPGVFSFNHNPKLTATFKNFGDLKTKLVFNNDLGLAYKIKEKLETTVPIQLTTPENLNYGAAIPLYYLTNHLPQIKIIPLQVADLPLKDHWELGAKIKHELELMNQRVALIAAGNLAHTNLEKIASQTDLPAEQFNQKFINYFTTKQTQNLLDISEETIQNFELCGLRPAVFLAGALDKTNYQAKTISYEMPLGIGWANLLMSLA